LIQCTRVLTCNIFTTRALQHANTRWTSLATVVLDGNQSSGCPVFIRHLNLSSSTLENGRIKPLTHLTTSALHCHQHPSSTPDLLHIPNLCFGVLVSGVTSHTQFLLGAESCSNGPRLHKGCDCHLCLCFLHSICCGQHFLTTTLLCMSSRLLVDRESPLSSHRTILDLQLSFKQ
jgi:hypothetical protein